jgi:hypothetical protein
MPFPLRRIARIVAAASTMGLIVAALEAFAGADGPTALGVLVLAGVAAYAAIAWFLDIGELRAVSRSLAQRLLGSRQSPRDRGADRLQTKLVATKR